jgi:hypothetical protein
MSLNTDVQLSIKIASNGISLPGFGVPMLLVQHTHYSDLLRLYTNPAQMITDGFLATDQVYLDAVALMEQNPSPVQFGIGKRAAPVAQIMSVALGTYAAGSVVLSIYNFGTGVTSAFTSTDSSDSAIVSTLVAAINAGSIGVTASGSGSGPITLTAGTAGVAFTCSNTAVSGTPTTITTTTANHGINEDLIAVQAYNPNWYGLLLPTRDDADNRIAAAAIESGAAGTHIFLAQGSSSGVLSAPYNSGSPNADIASWFDSQAFTRSSFWYHSIDTEGCAAAIMGQGLAQPPASITWKWKQLTGVTPDLLTDTQIATLQSKNANAYRVEANLGITFEGTMGNGQFIDVQHGIDQLYSTIQTNVLNALISAPKIPFTQGGIQLLADQVAQAIQSTVGRLVAPSYVNSAGTIVTPAYQVTAPLIQNISQSNRAARTIPAVNPITFWARLAGAVHKVAISGTISS